MQQFIARFHTLIQGAVSGFDRLLFRGSLRQLNHPHGMEVYLYMNDILFKHYADHVKRVSKRVKQASIAPILQQKLPVRFLAGRDCDKDLLARQIAAERGITTGDVCVLSAMELAPTFQHEGTHMVIRKRPTLTLYHYLIHPQFGWMYASMQTWFPFVIHVYINGREWLARSMDREKLPYLRQDNCFPWIQDYARAQQLLNEQLKANWDAALTPFAHRLNPLHEEIFGDFQTQYYWTVPQCEWATDIVFQPGSLERLSPRFLEHGMLSFSSPNVMQFLGKRIRLDGEIPLPFAGQITTSFRRRATGDRIKHSLNGNSVKCYGKAHTPVGDLFRVETTTNNVDDWKGFRPKEGGSDDDLQWRTLRRGVADLHRRAQISQKVNERYLNALSTVDDSTRLCELLQRLEQPCRLGQFRVRALHPFSVGDYALLEAVNRGEFVLSGLRNRDLQALLFASNGILTPVEKRRRSALVTRKLRLLRAHGLIQKVQSTHRYQVTNVGRLAITAVLSAARASLAQLKNAA